ncbi:hypothetical protein KCP71_08410 [Salmonella enterica subsp. enterica]|nr:hypothetical protein KCP71_08410 [Salmonella enterica subsp. enterica]
MRKVADDAPLMERACNMLCNRRLTRSWRATRRVSLMEITDEGYAILQFAAVATVAGWLSRHAEKKDRETVTE